MSDPFTQVIVGYDATEPAHDALRLGQLLAGVTGAELTVAGVYRSDASRADTVRQLARAREHLPYGSPASLRAVSGRSAAAALHGLAMQSSGDLLVLGASHRRGLALATVGGVADRLIHGAPCAVAVAPRGFADDPDAGVRVLGVAYDGSPEAKRTLALAAALGLKSDATLRIIGVVEPPPMTAAAGSAFAGYSEQAGARHDWLHGELEAAAASVPAELRPQTILASGDADEEIVRRAGILDLLVTGSRGRGPVSRVLLGSVSTSLVRALPCPVLVVPRGAASRGLRITTGHDGGAARMGAPR
jgi:nucleotide-binding universal stress UspA family protein